jgi:hypothetical protein
MSKKPIPTALSTHDRARLRKGAPTDGAALRRIWDNAYDAAKAERVATQPVPWRVEAARWLRRKAEQSTPDAGKTGWANPDYWRPQMLIRAAEELEAEQATAPYGEEPSDGHEAPIAPEMALAELVDKIAPGLDSGDLLDDAREASRRLEAQNAQRMSAICAAASSEDFAFDAVCKSVDEAMRASQLVRRLMDLADDFAEQAQNDGRQYCLTGDENWSEATWDRRAALQSSLRGAIHDGALLIVAHPEMMEAMNRFFGLVASNKDTGEQA